MPSGYKEIVAPLLSAQAFGTVVSADPITGIRAGRVVVPVMLLLGGGEDCCGDASTPLCSTGGRLLCPVGMRDSCASAIAGAFGT